MSMVERFEHVLLRNANRRIKNKVMMRIYRENQRKLFKILIHEIKFSCYLVLHFSPGKHVMADMGKIYFFISTARHKLIS